MKIALSLAWAAVCLTFISPDRVVHGQEIESVQAAEPARQEPTRQEADWQPLFNGVDLAGWRLVNTPSDTWSFQDGVLRCTGKPIGELRTEQMYQNFEMEIEWRHLVPGGNAGIFVWADDITARGVPFHRGIEVQVLENAYGNTNSHTTHGDIFPIHGAQMKPINGRGGQRAFPTKLRSKPSPEWNHYRIVCLDGTISLAVNGEIVTRGEEANPSKGYICIESEGGVVEYRNARIRELTNTPLEPGAVAIADRGFRSLYSGLDMRGWQVAEQAASHWLADDWVLRYDGQAKNVEASTIATEFADAEDPISGLIIDFRLLEIADGLQLALTGESSVDLLLVDSNAFAKYLESPGKWNRLEVAVEDKKLVWQVNGLKLEGPATPVLAVERGISRLSITPRGPIELANIYARAASDSTAQDQ